MPENTDEDTQPDDGVLSSYSRREYLRGAAGLTILATGGTGAYLALTDQSPDSQTYILQQGYLRWEVTPFSHDNATIEEFYNYQTPSASPVADLITEAAASRMFLYEGPVGTSLVFLHGSPSADHGGTAFFKFSGLSRSQGEWAVRDDPMGTDDDFEKWEGGNAKVKWEWGAGQTDGGAYWGVLDRDDFTIKITPKVLDGVDSWKFLTGTTENQTAFELYDEKSAKLKPTNGKKQVKQANVEIMPGTDPNEFDPYSKEKLTVAIKSPPNNADASDWVTPDDVDPGNYSVYFGAKSYLAGQNAASPQKYFRKNGNLYLKYKTKAANFTLDSAYGFIVGKTGSYTWFRGKDTVRPGGFNNVEREQAQLVVTDLNVNPEGGDRQNLANEYIEFKNDGDEPLDMTDYVIKDEAGWKFYMPDNFTLNPGSRFQLHTGDGQWDEDDLYWGLDTPVWGNTGDTIIVLNNNDETILSYTYPRQ